MGLFSRTYKKVDGGVQPSQPIPQPIQQPQYPIQQYQVPIQQPQTNIYVEKLQRFRNMLMGYILEIDKELEKYG